MTSVAHEQNQDARTTAVDHARATACRLLIALDGKLEKLMGRALLSRAYWPSLLVIYLAELEGKTLYQTGLSIADEEPAVNAHRRTGKLVEMGILTRERDPRDYRRKNLAMAPEIRLLLDEAIDALFLLPGLSGDQKSLQLSAAALIRDAGMRYYPDNSTDTGGSVMDIVRGKIIAGGRVALPADMRRSLGLQNGDTVLIEMNDEEIRIRPARSALRRIQDRLRAFASSEGLVSEELIAERRAEASSD
ncbi:AbrB/MazE/SpoVT family DNA-binding domain-containing protein [Sphingobium sp. RAC03]|uniref:AbrB/MazE/SpoVT family DNA-binding domain-containing protein n=1 Tax=Sphingobium sp. RAC03 TaxID=1843368 RepID=UPI0008570A77|nr:AbrB/MazE/SpoVT family DNA-binding domain-containing protein [Sphingobium sp. RAC03]AOF94695.1 transcriptional regulator, AbrB family domain protein [Sphingobium sp. RAC03]